MVKVLKTQDENYIRTMRAANIKVHTVIYSKTRQTLISLSQKIDKLKNKLTEMADLLKSSPLDEEEDLEDQLDETEIATLRKANILPEKVGRKRKHILFAESVDEGMCTRLSLNPWC